MIQSHPTKITPPRTIPQVLLLQKETYIYWLNIYKNFPKVERMGIGNKVEQGFLDLLELTFYSSYLSPEQKIPLLNKATAKLDLVKFFSQLCWESKLMTTDKYSEFILKLEEIGRQLGGWKKGIENKLQKTPQP